MTVRIRSTRSIRLRLGCFHLPLNSGQSSNHLPKKEFSRRVHGEVEEEGEEVCLLGPAPCTLAFFGFGAAVCNDPNQSISGRLRCG